MTDVIGTADIDNRPRRRAPTLPRWLLWSAVAVAVAGVIGVPYARNRLADSSAQWLQVQWSARSALDDARVAVIEEVNRSAGVFDDESVTQAAAVADREEATALRQLAHEMARHRTWTGDVARARDATLAAVQSEIIALERDARDQPTTGYLFAPEVDRLVNIASARVASIARAWHLPHPPLRQMVLPPAQSILDDLRSPTDFPTGLSLVVSDGRGPQIIDLDTGRRVDLPVPRGETEVRSWSGQVMVVSSRGVQAFDASGQRLAHFANGYDELLSSSGRTLWLNGRRAVREFDHSGHPLTPWIARPPGRSASVATGGFIVLNHVQDELTLVSELWNPRTGALRLLPPTCFAGWVPAARRVIAVPCGGDRAVTVVDVRTGRISRIAVPGRVTDSAPVVLSPLSPTGDELAVGLEGSGLRPGLLNLVTGHFLRVPGDGTLTAMAWSPDGQWVLLGDSQSSGFGRRPRLALWRPRDGRLTSVRLSPGTEVLGVTQLLAASRH